MNWPCALYVVSLKQMETTHVPRQGNVLVSILFPVNPNLKWHQGETVNHADLNQEA